MTKAITYGLLAATTALGAALLFWLQPMVGRVLLPEFGGSAAVWTTCLLVFQSLLFLGYLYAHKLISNTYCHPHTHLGLLLISVPLMAVLFLEDPSVISVGSPVLSAGLTLSAMVGLPYLLLSATSPVIQGWARTGMGERVYGLYAWSNAGSLVGLLAYPLLLEPNIPLSLQRQLWGCGYGLFVVLIFITQRFLPKNQPVHHAVSVKHGVTGMKHRAQVCGLSATGVVLLLAITETLSTDLTVTPLLWVLPLAVYLLTLVLAFGLSKSLPRSLYGPLLVIALLSICWLLDFDWRAHWSVQVGVWCVGLGATCLVCHAEMVRLRPAAEQLTEYYLWVAFGGACGGIFAGVLAPALFPITVELYIGLLATWLFFGWSWLNARRCQDPFAPLEVPRGSVFLGVIILVVVFGYHGWKRVRGDTKLYRNFYGSLQVKYYPAHAKEPRYVHLLDGRISHGFQYLEPDKQDRPTTYFVPQSGIGRILTGRKGPKNVAVMGLGTGTLAAYAQLGDRFVFYEINPDVEEVARTYFKYLERAKGAVSVRIGDGRKLLESEPESTFDVIVFDAFSGDAIPAHLVTEEAISMALAKLKPDGVLAINVSNNHADMKPVIWSHSKRLGLAWRRLRHETKSPFDVYISDWMFLAPRETAIDVLESAKAPSRWVQWTDDHAPLLPILY